MDVIDKIILSAWAVAMVVPPLTFLICALVVLFRHDAKPARLWFVNIIRRDNTLLLGGLYFILVTITVLIVLGKMDNAGVMGLIGALAGYVLGSSTKREDLSK